MCNEAHNTELDRERSLALLQDLVTIESPSGDREASARIVSLISDLFLDLNRIQNRDTDAEITVETVVTDAGTNLIVNVPGSGEPVLLVGHTDTVWPVGTLDNDVPWIQTHDTVAGPGTYDMKSGLTIMYEAIRAIAPKNIRATRIVLTCDEEVGSPTSVDTLKQASTGVAFALGFESPHPDGALKIGRRGSTRARVSVTGKPAHAALDPEKGISAVDELIDQLVRIRTLSAASALPSEVLCNIGVISGGTATNVIAAQAQALIGFRFIESGSERRVLDELAHLMPVRSGATVEVELVTNRPAWQATAADKHLAAHLEKAAAKCHQSLASRPAAGAGDTNYVHSFGIAVADGFGPSGAGAHAVNEHLNIASFFERIELVTQILISQDA
jgi:glutamate carboxypeptidase